jgi:Flp pilus assembly protein TadD
VLALVVGAVATAAAQAGGVRGTVIDVDGRPVKGAVITATHPNGRSRPVTSTSDDKGRFGMIGLEGGAWMFLAEAPGFARQRGWSKVRSTISGNAPLKFVMTPVVAPIPTSVSRRIDIELKTAHLLRADGKFDQAISAYQDIATKNPTLTMVQLVIGETYRRKAAQKPEARVENLEKALDRFDAVLKANPESERARIELALTQMAKGNHGEAERMLLAGAATGASREMVYALGEVRFEKGDTAGAEELFTRAATMDPTWLRPRLHLGLIAFQNGDRIGASRFFTAVVAADSEGQEGAEAQRYLKEFGL